jgi:YfiH family protein
MSPIDVIRPEWPAPPNVRALSTTRHGGVSAGPWQSLNLGQNCGDDPGKVAANRGRLLKMLPAAPLWMRQVHGVRVLDSGSPAIETVEADARVSERPGEVLAVLTADCLPLLVCDTGGERVAVAHAGWRGLAGGVIEATIERLAGAPERLLVWLGPAIGGRVYEVGAEVRGAFAGSASLAAEAVNGSFVASGDRWLLDLTAAARAVLGALGVENVFGGGYCTYSDPERFFSHRRDGVSGRMASVIWFDQK